MMVTVSKNPRDNADVDGSGDDCVMCACRIDMEFTVVGEVGSRSATEEKCASLA